MVNVIIVTYNGMQWIDKCLSSLQNQEIVSDIIIIDNGSEDGTISRIKNNYPEVRLIINQKNHGFGYSNNQAMQLSLSENVEYVFLLNQDAWVEADTIAKLVNIHKKNGQYGILSPIHLRGDGKALDMKFATFVAQAENHKLISDLYLHRLDMDEVYDVRFANAAAWLISRKCFENVGGFAPIYHHYGEDMDYANRVLYHGFRIGICPAAIIHHDRKNIIDLPTINNPERYLKIKKVWHLIYLTDINHSFLPRYIKLLVICFGSCLSSFLRFRFKNLWIYLKEFVILIGLCPKVLLNNRQAKKRGAAFLR